MVEGIEPNRFARNQKMIGPPGGGLRVHSRAVDVIQRSAGGGQRGLHVVFLQHRLRDLRYIVAIPGTEPLYTLNANILQLFISGWF